MVVSLALLSNTACIAAAVGIAVVVGFLIGDIGSMGSGGKGAMGVGRFRVVGAVNAITAVVVHGRMVVGGVGGVVAIVVGWAVAGRLVFMPFFSYY